MSHVIRLFVKVSWRWRWNGSGRRSSVESAACCSSSVPFASSAAGWDLDARGVRAASIFQGRRHRRRGSTSATSWARGSPRSTPSDPCSTLSGPRTVYTSRTVAPRQTTTQFYFIRRLRLKVLYTFKLGNHDGSHEWNDIFGRGRDGRHERI